MPRIAHKYASFSLFQLYEQSYGVCRKSVHKCGPASLERRCSEDCTSHGNSVPELLFYSLSGYSSTFAELLFCAYTRKHLAFLCCHYTNFCGTFSSSHAMSGRLRENHVRMYPDRITPTTTLNTRVNNLSALGGKRFLVRGADDTYLDSLQRVTLTENCESE
jgi:hypothetical protein